jgi:putative hemolysin
MTPLRLTLLALLAVSLLLCPGVSALLNPAALYCTGLNNTYSITTGPDGGQTGTCLLPNNTSVDAWEFLEGRVAQQYSYCGLNNYSVHTVTDAERCAGISSTRCALCVLPGGKETEATELMVLSFKEPGLVVSSAPCSGGTCSTEPPTTPPGSKNSIPVGGATILGAIGAAAGIARLFRQK